MNRHSAGSADRRRQREVRGRAINFCRTRAGLTTAAVEQLLGMAPRPDGSSYLAAVERGEVELLERFREPLRLLLPGLEDLHW